jgi:NAD(P)-dependent dehydrogenase (short-subunit alcohol dehydrogenase family)
LVVTDQPVSVVCGAAGELGRAVVAELTGRGDRVIAVNRSVDPLRSLVDDIGPSVDAEAVDLTRPEEVQALWDRIADRGHTPSAVVNAVGGYRSGSVIDTGFEDYRFLLDLNLTSTWLSCRHAAEAMRETGGSIVNVSARTGVEGGAGSAAYAISKSAVIRLTQLLAAETKAHGIRVNVILPAIIDTEANRASYPEEAMRKAVAPAAIARVVAFLCSDAAWPITGAAIPVPGRY